MRKLKINSVEKPIESYVEKVGLYTTLDFEIVKIRKRNDLNDDNKEVQEFNVYLSNIADLYDLLNVIGEELIIRAGERNNNDYDLYGTIYDGYIE